MSIKIYEAWRCDLDKTEELIDCLRNQMLEIVYARIEGFIGHVVQSFGDPPEHFKDSGKELWLRSKKLQFVLDRCIEAAKTSMSDPFDIECGINLWIFENKTYIIPIAPNFIVRKLKMPIWCEDYCYWNNADIPESVTSDAWDTRRKVWESVCTNDHNAKRLYHSVVEAKNNYTLFDISYKLGMKDVYEYLDNLEKNT